MKTTRFRSSLLRRLIACGFLGLLAFPFGMASSEEKLKPPGDCTDEDYEDLKKKKKLACEFDGQAEPGKCVETDSCYMLQRKENAFNACKNARVNLMNKCFRGGDSGHKTEATKMDNGAKTCNRLRVAREACNQPPGSCPIK